MVWQNSDYTHAFAEVFWNSLAGAQSNSLSNSLKLHIFSPWNSTSKNFKKNQKNIHLYQAHAHSEKGVVFIVICGEMSESKLLPFSKLC